MPKFRPPLWALVWLALVLLAGVIFLANTTAVNRLMDSIGLTGLLYPSGRTMTPQVVHTDAKPPTEVLADPAPAPSPEPLATVPDPDAQPDAAGDATAANTAPPPDVSATDEAVPPGPNTYKLYFSRLGPDGRMETVSWYRELPAGSTPLTATLKALLLGPTLQEKSQGALSLLPQGAKLLSVRLKDKTALVSFSEEFTRNTLGNEGLVGQLKQVVWTATQFSTVDAVQFLIAGQYRDTLGEEGLSIANPLTRASFP